MNFFKKGLFALSLIIFFSVNLTAKYLYKDEIIFNDSFSNQIEILGEELYQRTGISLRLVMLKKLPLKTDIVSYEKELIKNFHEPTILLTFSEMNSKVDIYSSDKSLYKYFDKEQVLSPAASSVQAFMMALFYSNNFDDFKENISNYGGTIIPILAQKAKAKELIGKYSAAMFNGYADIAEQIAKSKGIVLNNAVGDANKESIMAVKVLFYGFIIYAIFMYIKRKLYKKRHQGEEI